MTALVGILCRDGVVIGSDSSSTFGVSPNFRTIEQITKKIQIIGDRVIVAGTGEVGLGQRFCYLVHSCWEGEGHSKFRQQAIIAMVTAFAKVGIDDFAKTGVQRGSYGSLMAFPCEKRLNLCEFATATFQPEMKTPDMWFVSMGSGQPITDPFLALLRRVFWPKAQPSVKEAIFAVVWTLEHVIELNPGGIQGPPQIAVLEYQGEKDPQPRARLLDDDAISEHQDNVKGAEIHLAKYREILVGDGVEIPAVPA